MKGLLRVLLRPVILVWAAVLTRGVSRVPRPLDEGPVHAPGHDSDRVLLLGSGPAVSWGVLKHDLGLAGTVARGLAQLTGRGVDMTIVADPEMTASRAIEAVGRLRLERQDAVIVTLGINDAVALVSLRAWRRQVAGLVVAILAGLPADSRLFVTAIPPIRSLAVFRGPLGAIVAAHARAMNAITKEVCAAHSATDFVELRPLPPEPDRYRSTKGYEVWGGGLAEVIAPLMPDALHTRAVSGLDEAAASGWLAAIRASDGLALQQLLQVAAGIAGTRFAAFSLAVDDHVWGVSLLGGAPTDTTYQDSFTRATILSRDGIRVPDASLDERFAHAELVAGQPHLRFFAAHPIRSPEGSRIGALCVFDTEPDDGGRFETSHLRDIAQRIQQELRALASSAQE